MKNLQLSTNMMLNLFYFLSIIIVLVSCLDKFNNNSEISDMEFFKEASERFANNHKYINNTNLTSKDGYVCYNFSKDYETTMSNLGFEVNIIDGYPNYLHNYGHTWTQLIVSLSFEPQSAEFINYEEEYPSKRVIK